MDSVLHIGKGELMTKRVAKVLIVDSDDKYLLLERSAHPRFGNDPDLAGGTIEEGEQDIDAAVREVEEETGVVLDKDDMKLLYAGDSYSKHGTHYQLYELHVTRLPEIQLSWEHSGYEWISRTALVAACENAKDTYIQMVYDTLTK